MSNWLDSILSLGKKYIILLAVITAVSTSYAWLNHKYKMAMEVVNDIRTHIEVGTWFDFGMADITHTGLVNVDGVEVKVFIGRDARGGEWIWLFNGNMEHYRIDYDSLTWDYRFLDAERSFEHMGKLDGLKEIENAEQRRKEIDEFNSE